MLREMLLRFVFACVACAWLTSAGQAADFPLKDDERTELGGHRRMESDAQLSKDGTVVIKTKTWTDKKFKGFTGGVTLFIFDKDGNYLHHTAVQRYGVDGKGIPGKASRRNDVYTEKVPDTVVRDAAGVLLWHGLTPKPRLDDQIKESLKVSKAIKQIMEDLD